jgi:hypothetical protein
MAECEALNALGERFCPAADTRRYNLGCWHEHIIPCLLCPVHAASTLVCQECWLAESPLAHRCPLFRVDKDEILARYPGAPGLTSM